MSSESSHQIRKFWKPSMPNSRPLSSPTARQETSCPVCFLDPVLDLKWTNRTRWRSLPPQTFTQLLLLWTRTSSLTQPNQTFSLNFRFVSIMLYCIVVFFLPITFVWVLSPCSYKHELYCNFVNFLSIFISNNICDCGRTFTAQGKCRGASIVDSRFFAKPSDPSTAVYKMDALVCSRLRVSR